MSKRFDLNLANGRSKYLQVPTFMAERRFDTEDTSRVKRQKISGSDMDPKANPYLAHMYEESPEENGYSNGYGGGNYRTNGASQGTSLAKFKRHSTTTAMANKAEDGPNNPFSGQPLSKQYFNILKTRRGLPVHAQRYVQMNGYQHCLANFVQKRRVPQDVPAIPDPRLCW